MKSKSTLPIIIGLGAVAAYMLARGASAKEAADTKADPEGSTANFTDQDQAAGTPEGVPLLGSDAEPGGSLLIPAGNPPLLNLGTVEVGNIIQRQADLARVLFLLGYPVRSDFQYSAASPVPSRVTIAFAKDYNAISRAMAAKSIKFMPEGSLGGGLLESGTGQTWQTLAAAIGALRYAWTASMGPQPKAELATQIFDGDSFLRRFINRGRSADLTNTTANKLYNSVLPLAKDNWRNAVAPAWQSLVSRYTAEGFRNLP